MRRRAAGLAMLGAALLYPVAAGAQCALCKAAVTSSEEGQRLAGTLNDAILVMLAGPYLIVGTFVAVAFHRQIRSRLTRWAARLPRFR